MKEFQKTIHSYTVVFEPAEEGGFVASVPALPGCMTQGETFEEAKEMAKDAIKGYIEVLRKDNEEVPESSDEAVISTVAVEV